MPRCIVCDTPFARLSWGSPEEPCDCGGTWTRRDAQAQPEAVDAAKVRWQRQVKAERIRAARARRRSA